MEERIVTESGEPFGKKGALVMALQRLNLEKQYDLVETEPGKWVGQKKKSPKLIKCRVHRSNVDPDNRDLIININVNQTSKKKSFFPGQEVELSPEHISVLKDSVEEVRLAIPLESGIYESANPLQVAKNFYPNMTPEVDPASGVITMIQRTPNYIIERTED
jgi:hypothetical protein